MRQYIKYLSNNLFFLFTFIHIKMFDLINIPFKWIIGGILIGILLYVVVSYLSGPIYNMLFGKGDSGDNNNSSNNSRETMDLEESVEEDEVISRPVPVVAKMTLIEDDRNDNVRFEEVNETVDKEDEINNKQIYQDICDRVDNEPSDSQLNDNQLNDSQLNDNQMMEPNDTQLEPSDNEMKPSDNQEAEPIQMDMPDFDDSHSDNEFEDTNIHENNDEFIE